MPQRFNPPEGYLFAANNNITGATYPYYLSNLWEPPSRAQRIQQWLSGKADFTIDDFKRMQQDVNSPWAGTILPIVCEIVKRHLEKTPNETLNNLYHLIKDWDGVEAPQSVETSILHAFFVKLTENTLKDEMREELYHHYIQFANIPFRVMTHLLEKPASAWFDDVETPEVETMDDVVIRSLLDADIFLRHIAGDDLLSWRWGEIHQLTFRHPLAVKQPLDFILNRGPFSRGGSVMTINNTQYRFDQPFDVSLAPSTRQLVDLADVEHSFSVIAPGQSGQCLSDHFDDQLPLWLQGQYHSVSMNQTEISLVSKQHLFLKPKLIK